MVWYCGVAQPVPQRDQIERGDLWGEYCIAFVTPKVIEIDTEEDLQYAEWKYAMRGMREEVRFR